jgi:hypothetical protein
MGLPQQETVWNVLRKENEWTSMGNFIAVLPEKNDRNTRLSRFKECRQ